MSNSSLVICQGIHISKILASILSYSPEECIILRSHYDINSNTTDKLNTAISQVLDYLNSNLKFFQTISKIYEVKADIFNPYSVMKSLEYVKDNTDVLSSNPVVDLSAGPTPACIGLYLFAISNKITEIHFSFPGERYLNPPDSYLAQEENFEANIEFARKFTYNIPSVDLDFYSIDEEILMVLAKIEDGYVDTLKSLNILLGREGSSKNLMKLSRECSKLESFGMIRTSKSKKSKNLSLTSFGQQYVKHHFYDKPELKLIWERKE